MKKIFGRVKIGWVYLLGTVLMVGFSYLALEEGNISVQGAKEETPIQETKQDGVGVKNEPADTSTTSKRGETQPQNKAASRTKTKPNTAIQQIQTRSVATTQSQTVNTSNPTVIPSVQKDTVAMDISGLGSYKVEMSRGENAFQVLQAAANQNGFNVEYKIYSWGVMITKIGTTKAQGTYYWALYYNGNYSSVGANDLILKNKDKVEWRYESWM